ncbi:MMPL family transporter [Nocardioidaceae bacterium]|nr:MMPL family transporter [Nocardioidaceae bacterium]
MTSVFRHAVRRPLVAILVWVVALVALGIGALVGGGSYDDSFTLPDTESSTAQNILAEDFGGATSQAVVQVVYRNEAPVREAVSTLLSEASDVDGVAQVVSPIDLPARQAAQQGLVSEDGSIAQGRIVFDGEMQDVDVASVREIVDLAEQARADIPTGDLGLAGQILQAATTEPPATGEIVGLTVAAIVLLIAFGSVVAAGLPILTAALGLAGGLGAVTILANVFTIATFGPTLATMIGLGVGIDYGLFVVNRYRRARHDGAEPRDAVLEAVSTAGRAVLFAAFTVIIALLGLFVLGIGFMNGLAIAAAVTVAFVMLSATLLLPAALSLLGKRSLAGKVPGADKRSAREGRLFSRWADVLQKRPGVIATLATVVLLAIASPVLDLRSGFPDASGDAEGSLTRVAYELTAEGFGDGANGPFLVAVELGGTGEQALAPAAQLVERLNGTEGVAFASPPQPSEAGDTALIQVQPTTGPQDPATGDTLDRIRDDVVPAVLDGTDAQAYVGGSTAISADFTTVLVDALPLFLSVVVGLGFLMLVLLFRSVLVPALGAVSSLLSLAVSLGVTTLVFQDGFANGLLGVTGTGPILPFVPIMVFAILFGLAMDYQVFLVSRMQEEWQLTGEPTRAVRAGLVGSGRVVVAAALILASVFLAFVSADDRIIKTFGLALGLGVLVDAFVVRLIIVPAVMTKLGRATWWLPSWLGRVLPTVDVEGESAADPRGRHAAPRPEDEPEPVAAGGRHRA